MPRSSKASTVSSSFPALAAADAVVADETELIGIAVSQAVAPAPTPPRLGWEPTLMVLIVEPMADVGQRFIRGHCALSGDRRLWCPATSALPDA